MKLVQAARLSRLGDAATGLDKQDEAAQRYADAYGHEIIATAPDADVSGSVSPWDRPELGKWLADSPPKDFDGIIAAHLDRLGRNARHLARLREWCEDHHKKLITVEPAVDWSSDTGQLIYGIMAWLAEQELKAIRRRNIETQTWLRANGFLVGKPPFGFKVVTVDGTDHKTLEPDERTAPIVREMCERYLAGESLTDICVWLESEGIKPPNGERWYQRTVSGLLRNPILTGRRKNEAGQTVLNVPPLIDSVTFQRVQRALDAKAWRKGTVAGDGAMLTGVVQCPKCHRDMWRLVSTRKRRDGTKYSKAYYRCFGTAREPSTCKVMLPLEEVDRIVSEGMQTIYAQTEATRREWVPGTDDHSADIELIEADLRSLDFDDPEFPSRQAELLAERKRLLSLPDEPGRWEIVNLGVTVGVLWSRMDGAERREWLTDNGFNLEPWRDAGGRLRVTVTKSPWKLEQAELF